ncbi:MAG: DUF5985 family protein [Alphaproteobacteria bacterium]
MPFFVYALCFVTSLVCLVLLLRAYLRTRNRMLLWSSLCFVGLSLNNLLLFLDIIVFPDIDLRLPRLISSVAAAAVLLFGFLWEAEY